MDRMHLTNPTAIAPRTGRRVAFTAAMALLALAACGATRETATPQPLATGSTPAVHAVENDRLEQLMRDLRRLTPDRLPPNLDVASERKRRFRELAEAADAMATLAGQMPALADELDLTPAAHGTFIALADRLQKDALQIRLHASEQDARGARAALQDSSTTCAACHDLFRAPRPTD